jgi:hypothetical protein
MRISVWAIKKKREKYDGLHSHIAQQPPPLMLYHTKLEKPMQKGSRWRQSE